MKTMSRARCGDGDGSRARWWVEKARWIKRGCKAVAAKPGSKVGTAKAGRQGHSGEGAVETQEGREGVNVSKMLKTICNNLETTNNNL